MKIFKKVIKQTSDSQPDNIEVPENAVYKKTALHYTDGKLSHTRYHYYDIHDNEILCQLHDKTVKYYYTYNDYGKVSIISYIYCNSEHRHYYEYNLDKTTSKENCYINGELRRICVYNYNANNQLAKKDFTVYGKDGKITDSFYVEYEYNNNGKLSVERYADKNGIPDIEYFTYDSNGNLIRKDVEHKTEKISFYEIYTYDSDNQLIKTENYFQNKLYWSDEYKYEFF